jgi:hypothetical protein
MFDPQPHLIKLPRKVKDRATGHYTTVYDDYLEVKWRVLMFRERYPHGVIITEEVCVDLDRGYARYKATVADGEGGQATGYGTETQADFADFCERAETRALGRALAVLGFGTQFVGQDLTEGDHVADAPVRPPTSSNGHAPEADAIHGTGRPDDPEPPLTADEINALVELAHSIGVDLQGFGHDMRRLMQLAEETRVTKKLLRASMTRPQYQHAWQAYSTRLRQEVEQSLTSEDVPDHAPPAANGQGPALDLTPDERLRWGTLSRRSMQVGLSATTWDALRQGDYAAAERVIAALERPGAA